MNANGMRYLAHSANRLGATHRLKDHLQSVASLAAKFSHGSPWEDDARIAGLLHDLGKYGDLFQQRLRGDASAVDHWSAGAWSVLQRFRMASASLAIQGHHIGLQRLSGSDLRRLDPNTLVSNHPLGLRLSEVSAETLISRFLADGLLMPSAVNAPASNSIPGEEHIGHMLDIRMLFSALVDADFLDTEAHFEATTDGNPFRPEGPALNPDTAFVALERFRAKILPRGSSPQLMRLREDLWQACVSSASAPPGLWTLSAPTGAGKTLAMLGFALKHARHINAKRIVFVIPYLTIIEQTGSVYRSVFKNFPPGFVLEHHSLAVRGTPSQDRYGNPEQLLAENWDAPIIVTTSVQFLESLFSNRSSACRKLHRLKNSLILFDEVQTLPLALTIPTLAALAHIARYRTSVVFSTATQPAFGHLNPAIREWTPSGWQANELASPALGLFSRLRRTNVSWPKTGDRPSWAAVAERLAAHEQVLCIVNLKRHASDLVDLLRQTDGERLLHLSTRMCPCHRGRALDMARDRLKRGHPCIMISTQCIESGVDIDFPTVFRAFGPLEAIAQAAGRCNREGKQAIGNVHVFLPEDAVYPDRAYEQASAVTQMILQDTGPGGMDLHDPFVFQRYYRALYDLTRPGALRRELQEAIKAYDFPAVATEYHVVPDNSINILVPYEPQIQTYQDLRQEAEEKGLRTDWIRRARLLSVSLFRPKDSDPIWHSLTPVRIRRNENSDEWFIYQELSHYNDLTGLSPPGVPPVWLA
jgi:CRISPR-associated helicase Cas3/CRISPR-associated endonuclease Cas3-HD